MDKNEIDDLAMNGVLRNIKHEKFAQLVASGASLVSSYRSAYPKTVSPNMYILASRLASNKKVAERIRQIKRVSMCEAIMTADELKMILTKTIRQGDDEGNIPAVVSAGKLLADLIGANAPKKIEQTVNAFVPRELEALSDTELERMLKNGKTGGAVGADEA